jgi:hypothetical protein
VRRSSVSWWVACRVYPTSFTCEDLFGLPGTHPVMQHEYHPAMSAAIFVVPESLWGVIGPPEKPVATTGFASKPPGV